MSRSRVMFVISDPLIPLVALIGRAVAHLSAVFAHYDRNDIARALRATMDVYRWLEDENGAAWGYIPPTEGERQAAESAFQMRE